ncbi:MAG: hypothetical protein PHR83_09935 [Paludibacter sp.]|nr:hypothetical protein [Paludibacter sp.]
MRKVLISAISIMFFGLSISAQNSTNEAKDSFKPSGKPIVTVFSDFSNTTTGSTTNNAFELSRAYFGYGYNFSPDFTGKVVFDVANAAGLNPSAFTAFLKNAYAEYSHGIVKANLGLIGTTMFNVQESFWGKRYLYKSFQDQYGFGSSADLGASVKLQFIPEVSLDLAVFNGEGYKKVQADSTMQFAAGLTLQPIKNLYVRAYYDYMANQSYATAKVAQTSFNVFVGYKTDKGSIGAEYNSQNGNKNTSGHNWSGLSVYGTLPFANQFTAIARFDNLMSDKVGTSTTGWNTTTDGQVYLAGVEYAPVKGIQITPNIRYSKLTSGTSSTSLNVNLGMSF